MCSSLSHQCSCAAAVGRQVYLENEGQEVSLTPSCAETRGNIIHELGHVVGLWHEVTRYDRDDYIEILWRNIRRGAEIWFRTVSKEATDALGTAYDLGSIMHFSPEEYAVKGKVAFRVQPNITYNGVVGQRDSLSSSDIYKISLLYGCDSRKSIVIGVGTLCGLCLPLPHWGTVQNCVDCTAKANGYCNVVSYLLWVTPSLGSWHSSHTLALRLHPL